MACSPRCLEILTGDQVRDVHQTALRVLEEVGLWLPDRDVLEVFADAGARVDMDAQTVLIPPDLVEASLREVPSGFTWVARNPAHTLTIDGTGTWFMGPDSALNVIGLNEAPRRGTAADGVDICRLCDGLANVSGASAGVHPDETSDEALAAWVTKTMFTCSSKPVFAVSRSKAASTLVIRMAEAVSDVCDLPRGALPLMAVSNTVSPLYNTPGQLAGMLEYIRQGIPLLISPEVQAGATGPATLAGALAQATAEFLGHATLAQLVNPGIPLVYGCVSSALDMRTAILPYGAPEADLLCLATAQMARHYGIPSRGTGGSSDAHTLGMQAGAESLMSNLVCILAGVSIVAHGAGELQNTLAVSFEKTVVDDELIGMVRRLAGGIDVSSETLAFDVIREIGPRGHFLTEDHTVKHYRNEHFIPSLLVRDRYETWTAGGAKRMEERARDLAQHLLDTHEPLPLPRHVVTELDAIYASTRVAV